MQWRSIIVLFRIYGMFHWLMPYISFPSFTCHTDLRVILEACFSPLFYHVPVASLVSDLSIALRERVYVRCVACGYFVVYSVA